MFNSKSWHFLYILLNFLLQICGMSEISWYCPIYMHTVDPPYRGVRGGGIEWDFIECASFNQSFLGLGQAQSSEISPTLLGEWRCKTTTRFFFLLFMIRPPSASLHKKQNRNQLQLHSGKSYLLKGKVMWFSTFSLFLWSIELTSKRICQFIFIYPSNFLKW